MFGGDCSGGREAAGVTGHRFEEVVPIDHQQLGVGHGGDGGRARHVAQQGDLTE